MSNLTLREDSQNIAVLTLNRPEALNALSNDLMADLHAALDLIAGDEAIRAVIIRGAGKGFCAGHDLKEMTRARDAKDGGRAAFGDLFQRCSALMMRVQSLPQPVIAQVHGVAAAAGCQLVATCDLAVADKATRFAVNGVNIGLFCSTPMVALSRNIGRKQAFEMLTTGEFIDGRRAAELGLINRAVSANVLADTALDLAGLIANKPRVAVKIGKVAFYQQLDMSVAEAYDFTAEVMAENMMQDDTVEGISAFIEKREPKWGQ